jgi:prolyl oligopeptidase
MRSTACTALLALCLPAGAIDYPASRKIDHADNYHGTVVPDPYRWLENDRAPETEAWVKAQNEVTARYLSQVPYKEAIYKRLMELNDYAKQSAPFRRGNTWFYTKNTGLQNQDVWYMRKGLEGAEEMVLDPNTLSQDGTSRLSIFSPSRDAKYVVYGVSVGGSDWQEFRVMELSGKKVLPDVVRWVKVGGVGWKGDGFYYSRYPEPEKGKELSSKNEFHAVYFHRVGTGQAQDTIAYEDKVHPLRFHSVRVTEDQKFAILNVSERGRAALGNALYWRDESKGESAWRPLFPEIGDTEYQFVDHVNGRFLVITNKGTPNFKLVSVDPMNPAEAAWKTVIPEKPEALQGVTSAGGKLFARYLKDVATRVEVYGQDGKLENEVPMPGLGTAMGFGGQNDEKFVYYKFASFLSPGAIYRYDIAAKKSSPYWAPKMPFAFNQYETKRVFATSKDGTKVPVFLTYRKGLKLDGNNPALLYGYGGFSLSQMPQFSPERLALLERGVVYASVGMRGGLEYGEKWHEAGMRGNKQNVFDDFIAAAEWLVKEKYSNPSKLACAGGSNGGLLVGAVINQRPELYRAALPAVGVMDMLRFQRFTIGWNWVAEYGTSENAADFAYLYKYSPLHNVQPGKRYPAVLVTTADHDDRVVPAHSFKYTAAMQEKVSKENPVLIRVEVNSGHGASSTAKRLAITADQYAFLLWNLDVKQ